MGVEYVIPKGNWYVNYDRTSPYFGKLSQKNRDTNTYLYAQSISGRIADIRWTWDNGSEEKGILSTVFVDMDTGETDTVILNINNFITHNFLNCLLSLIEEHTTFLHHTLKLATYSRKVKEKDIVNLSLNKPSVNEPNTWTTIKWAIPPEQIPKAVQTVEEFTGQKKIDMKPTIRFWKEKFDTIIYPLLHPVKTTESTSGHNTYAGGNGVVSNVVNTQSSENVPTVHDPNDDIPF